MAINTYNSLQFAVYVVGGLATVAIDISMLAILLKLQLGSGTAATLALISAFLVNYIFHCCVTFKKRVSLSGLVKHSSIFPITWAITFFSVITSDFAFHDPMLGKYFALLVSPLISYLLAKNWVFRTKM